MRKGLAFSMTSRSAISLKMAAMSALWTAIVDAPRVAAPRSGLGRIDVIAVTIDDLDMHRDALPDAFGDHAIILELLDAITEARHLLGGLLQPDDHVDAADPLVALLVRGQHRGHGGMQRCRLLLEFVQAEQQ